MDYVEWLEYLVQQTEPDWICDQMISETSESHKWCYENCCEDAWNGNCLKKHYELYVKEHEA